MVRRFSVIELLSMSARDPSEAESFVYAKDYDAAQARIRELKFQISEIQTVRNAEAKTAQARIRELEADLRKYGAHKKNCRVFGPIGKCDCGLNDALGRCSTSDSGESKP